MRHLVLPLILAILLSIGCSPGPDERSAAVVANTSREATDTIPTSTVAATRTQAPATLLPSSTPSRSPTHTPPLQATRTASPTHTLTATSTAPIPIEEDGLAEERPTVKAPAAADLPAEVEPSETVPILTVEPTPSETALPVTTSPTETSTAAPTTAPQPTEPVTRPDASISPAVVGPAAPQIYETTISIATYGYEQAFVPTAEDDQIYPYPRLDFGQVAPPSARSYRAIVLENGYVSVTILPELGGRIYSWKDKSTGRELLYRNPVVKPTSWGYRGWWLAAGGIEWAFPVEEHGLNEWQSWDAQTSNDGNRAAVSVSSLEARTGMSVGATISLTAGQAYLTIQPWATNGTGQTQKYQLWLNAMLTLGDNTTSDQLRFIVPNSQVFVHSTGDGGVPPSGATMTWPIHNGRDMSWYANWTGYLGFFISTEHGYVGLYDYGRDQGVVRAHSPNWPSGAKIFGPATLSPSLWTDDNSRYVELWSGATGSFWHYADIEPGQTVSWTEVWYPVHGMGGFNFANQRAALRLEHSGVGMEIAVAVSSYVDGRVVLFQEGSELASWPIQIGPGQAFRTTLPTPPETAGQFGLRLTDANGNNLAQVGNVP